MLDEHYASREDLVGRLSWSVEDGARDPTSPSSSDTATLESTIRIELQLIEAAGGRSAEALDALTGVLDVYHRRFDSAVERLQRATASRPEDGRLWNDLAVAYLERGRGSGELLDFLRALEASSSAVERLPRDAVAVHNLVLSLHLLGLHKQAREEAGERGGPLRQGSIERALASRSIELDRAPWSAADLDRALQAEDSAAVERTIASYPDGCRHHLLSELLPAVLGDESGSNASTRRAVSFATRYAEITGDSFALELLEAVRFLEASDRRSARQAVAAILQAQESSRDDEQAARNRIEQAWQVREDLSGPLRDWLETSYLIHASLSSTNPASPSLIDTELSNAAWRVRQTPWLAGRLLRARGLNQILGGRPTEAVDSYRRSAAAFRSIGAVESEIVARSLTREALDHLRISDAARSRRFEGLLQQERLSDAFERYNVLQIHAESALSLGYPRASLRILRTLLTVAEEMGNAAGLAHVHWQRARTRHRLGYSSRALEDLDAMEREARRDADLSRREGLLADARLVRGEILTELDDARASRELEGALEHYRTAGERFRFRLIQAYSAWARLQMHSLDREPALLEAQGDVLLQRIDDGLAEFEAQLPDSRSRSLLLDGARPLVDLAVRIHMDRKDAAAALEVADRGRNAGTRPSRRGDRPEDLPARTTLVYYHWIDERLAAWRVTKRGSRSLVLEAGKAELSRDIDAMFAHRADPGPSPAFEASAARLYDTLVAPVLDDDHDGLVVFVPDGVLHRVAFAALFDSRRSEYLIERGPIGFAPSIAAYSALRQVEPWREGLGSAYISGDPAFSAELFEGFPRLPHAQLEARELHELWPGSRLSVSEAATGRALLAEAGRTELIHVAAHGHAADPAGSSFLLLADEAGRPGSGPLDAHRIESLNWTGTRLVMLSSCNTASGEITPSSGAITLARSFLRGGVPTVVANLWPVDDRSATWFAVELHRHLREGMSPHLALWRTQRRAIAAADHAAPAVWAGFQAFGATPAGY